MNVLIVYGSTEGQTRKIARYLADAFARLGKGATLQDAADADSEYRISGVDAVVIAASVHVGRYQSSVRHLVKANATFLNAVPTAFLSVSLAAAGDDDDLNDVAACAERFLHETGLSPRIVEHVAGAFRYTEYDFFKRWVMKLIAREHGQPTDTSKDYELTDWPRLDAFCERFVAEIPN